MEKDTHVTEVVFRKWKKREDAYQSVIALFPYVFDDSRGHLCMSYQHTGQHGSANYNWLVSVSNPPTVPAGPEEYADLKRELERIGYNLKVIKKVNSTKLTKARETYRNELVSNVK